HAAGNRAQRMKTLLAALLMCALSPVFVVAGEPPCDCARPAHEGYVPVEGGRVWYRIIGEGKATPLIILHGGPGFTSYAYEPLAAALADERPVIVYDQLGCGRSDRSSDTKLWTVARFERELAALRTALKLDRIYLLGHSWGGQLAVEHALA